MLNNPMNIQSTASENAAKAKKRATFLLVEQVLAELSNRQSSIAPEQRVYPTSAILEVAEQLRPGLKLHPSTLGRNEDARKLIALLRTGSCPEPDFRKISTWIPQSVTSNRSVNRRRAYLSKWTIAELAERLTGLTELERHCDARRQILDTVDLLSTPWPDHHPYPMSPFVPSSTALQQYTHLLNRATKPDLVRLVLSLEKQVAEHLAHLLRADQAHLRRQLAHKE